MNRPQDGGVVEDREVGEEAEFRAFSYLALPREAELRASRVPGMDRG